MRNPVVQMLPAGSTLAIKVEPEISADERPFVFTMFGGKSPVTVAVETTSSVHVHNPMASAVPFVFFVGPQLLPPDWIVKALAFIGQLKARTQGFAP